MASQPLVIFSLFGPLFHGEGVPFAAVAVDEERGHPFSPMKYLYKKASSRRAFLAGGHSSPSEAPLLTLTFAFHWRAEDASPEDACATTLPIQMESPAGPRRHLLDIAEIGHAPSPSPPQADSPTVESRGSGRICHGPSHSHTAAAGNTLTSIAAFPFQTRKKGSHGSTPRILPKPARVK